MTAERGARIRRNGTLSEREILRFLGTAAARDPVTLVWAFERSLR